MTSEPLKRLGPIYGGIDSDQLRRSRMRLIRKIESMVLLPVMGNYQYLFFAGGRSEVLYSGNENAFSAITQARLLLDPCCIEEQRKARREPLFGLVTMRAAYAWRRGCICLSTQTNRCWQSQADLCQLLCCIAEYLKTAPTTGPRQANGCACSSLADTTAIMKHLCWMTTFLAREQLRVVGARQNEFNVGESFVEFGR